MENYYPKPEKDTISNFILNTIFGSFMKTKSVNNGNFAAEGRSKKRGTVRITHVLYSALNSKYAQNVLQIHMQP